MEVFDEMNNNHLAAVFHESDTPSALTQTCQDLSHISIHSMLVELFYTVGVVCTTT